MSVLGTPISDEPAPIVEGYQRAESSNGQLGGYGTYKGPSSSILMNTTTNKQYIPIGVNGEPLPLPRTSNGIPVPDVDSSHTQIGWREGRKGGYRQTREFGDNGRGIKTTDWTDHGRSHPNPHDHYATPNPTGGTPKRGDPVPMKRD